MAALDHGQDPRAIDLPPYRIASRDDDLVVVLIDVLPDLICLMGHFSVQPIVPGIALFDWAVQLADQVFACGRAVVGTRNLKFKKVVEPHTSLELTLEYLPEKNRVKFIFVSEHGQHASGIIELVPA